MIPAPAPQPTSPAAPVPLPPGLIPPRPRQLLAAAQAIAQGETESMAAAAADIDLDTLLALRDGPGFTRLLGDCRAVLAMPRADQDERLDGLLRRAVERALMHGHIGAIPAAMRLLGLLPTRAPTTPSPRGDGPDDADGTSPDTASPSPPTPAELWGLHPNERGGWNGPDGKPAMPDRRLTVVETSGGPARLLDMDDLPGDIPGLIELFEDKGEDEIASFNRGAHRFGGAQWDPVTRTLWRLGRREPDPTPPPTSIREPDLVGGHEPAVIADPAPPLSEMPASEAPRAAAPSAVLPTSPAGQPHPADDSAPAEPAASATRPARPPRPLSPPSPMAELRARLERLLARDAAPSTPEDADLAEAVCALLWPHWPTYTGPINHWTLRDVLAQVPVHPRQLALLGGESCTRPAAKLGPLPPPPPPPTPPCPTGKAGRPDPSRGRSRGPP